MFALSLPNLVVKLKEHRESRDVEEEIKVSLIDNRNVLNILSYRFYYDTSKWRISYNKPDEEMKLFFNSSNKNAQLVVENQLIQGPVSEYALVISPSKDCEHFLAKRTDVFTKMQCLLYY